jgi:endonuclease G
MIDGERLRKESRSSQKFKFDPRLSEDVQIGDELYSGNKLDRGHIARRADLIWGSQREAQRANADSFFFTNIHPQHERFNQSSKRGLWGELENAIYDEVEVLRQRLVVFGGPIFKKDDPEYRDVRIPRSFWKLIGYIDAEDKRLHAKAYVLSQDDLLSDLEAFDLDEFRLYQLSIDELERRVGLKFDADLRKADTFERSGPEGVGVGKAVREIHSRAELVE